MQCDRDFKTKKIIFKERAISLLNFRGLNLYKNIGLKLVREQKKIARVLVGMC